MKESRIIPIVLHVVPDSTSIFSIIKIFHNAQIRFNFVKLASLMKMRYRNGVSEYGLQLDFQIA